MLRNAPVSFSIMDDTDARKAVTMYVDGVLRRMRPSRGVEDSWDCVRRNAVRTRDAQGREWVEV